MGRASQVFIPWGRSLSGLCRHAASESATTKTDAPRPLAAPPGPCPIAGVSATPAGERSHLPLRTAWHTHNALVHLRPIVDSAAACPLAPIALTCPPHCPPRRRARNDDSTARLQPYLCCCRNCASSRTAPASRRSSFPQSLPLGPGTQATPFQPSLLGALSCVERPAPTPASAVSLLFRTASRRRVCCRASTPRDCPS